VTPTALARSLFDVQRDQPGTTPLRATRRARIGVVGTGHGVGTTTVAAAIAAGMRAAGVRVGALKPLSCGGLADAERLRAATGSVDPLELVAPIRFTDALAPLVAARRARTTVDPGALDHAFAMLAAAREAVIVDATGPLLTPITETESFATLFARWSLDLVLVAPNARDAVGSVLAAASVARAHGLAVQGVVLTTLVPVTAFGAGAERTNQAVLKELLRTVPVIALPHTSSPEDPGALAALAREFAARAAFTRPA
jgi:dethiobiotin synthetase